ncbi:MAG: hypothetical protein JNK33_03600 [Candidatus Doudnabacteria bacterium]|nr:hypothetical protein [Candidatus Doudnabacteria bacterium]
MQKLLGAAETGGLMFVQCATIGLVVCAALFMLLIVSELPSGEALGLALFGGVLAGLVSATPLAAVMLFPFHHPTGGGMVYGMIMAAIAGWRRGYQHIGMVIVGTVSGLAIFLLLDKGGGLLLPVMSP